jgi:copper(I)-binding protein
MLEGLKRSLKEGETVALTLQFVDARGNGQTVKVQAAVRALGAR